MATASTIVRGPGSRARELARAANPLWAALAIVAVVAAVRAFGTVDPDVSWQLWIAHELNGGVRLYRDIVEANPPLWFWMAMPIDWAASLIHVRSDHVLIVAIGFAAALSLAATNRLLEPASRSSRTLLLAYAALILVAMPWQQFGQREQIALIGTLPYAALIAARRRGERVSPGFAFVVGAGAAVGLALKHYFLLVPVLVELWLLAGQGRKWRPFRAETIAVAAVGTLYAGAFAFFARDYFSVQLPLILLAYGVTGAERVVDLFQPAVLTALATLLLLVATSRRAGSGLAAAMMVSATGFAAAYFIQAKGWSYHAVPLAGCAAIALAAFLSNGAKSRLVVFAAPALLFLPFWIGAQQAMREDRTASDVEQAVRGLGAGENVGFIGTDPALGWTVTLQHGFAYPSRYYGFWMMRAVVNDDHADPRLRKLGRQVVADTVQDFRCASPRRIIVARPTPAEAKAGSFDILAFFLRDPQFAELLTHYRPVQRTSVETFELASPLGAASECVRRA
jgi:hypothetical protein